MTPLRANGACNGCTSCPLAMAWPNGSWCNLEGKSAGFRRNSQCNRQTQVVFINQPPNSPQYAQMGRMIGGGPATREDKIGACIVGDQAKVGGTAEGPLSNAMENAIKFSRLLIVHPRWRKRARHVVMRTNEPDTVSSGGLRSGVNKNGRKCQSRRSRPWDCSTCTKERGLDQRRPQVKRKMPRVCTASQKFVGAGQEWCGL